MCYSNPAPFFCHALPRMQIKIQYQKTQFDDSKIQLLSLRNQNVNMDISC